MTRVSVPGPGAHPKKTLKITSTLPTTMLKILLREDRPWRLCLW
jgi:hypothetical protein